MNRRLFFRMVVLSLCCVVLLAADRAKKPNAAKTLANSVSAERLDEMEEASRAFADRFVTILSDACDTVRKNPVSDIAARETLRLKLHDSSSVYSMATLPNPLSQLLNLITVSTLGYIRWVKEEHAKELFGTGAGRIEEAFTEIHEDIWRVAERFFSPQEISELHQIIFDWRKNHPQDRLIAYVRFDDFASSTNNGAAEQVGKGFFAQVAEANRNVAATRQFAERAFFYTKRMPRLLQWQTERTSDALLENPEVRRVLEDFHETSAALRDVGAEIRRVDQRYAMITGILGHVETILERADQVGGTIQGALRESEATFHGINDASTSLNETLTTFHSLYSAILTNKSSEPDPARPSEPFDVRHYGTAATELGRASRELNALFRETEGVVASPAWTQRIEEINKATQQRVNHVSARVIQIILLFFALLALYSWFAHKLRSSSRSS
jgi:hypothetical protein